MRRVHRLASQAEIAVCPRVYTFNRATGHFHDRAGFPIADCPSEALIVRKSKKASKEAYVR